MGVCGCGLGLGDCTRDCSGLGLKAKSNGYVTVTWARAARPAVIIEWDLVS
jgi:hypothetical protein